MNSGKNKPAVFLDRDGTIIEDRGHLRSPEEVRFLPGAIDALRSLSRSFSLFIVTHQVGVARGFLSMPEVDKVNQHVASILLRYGVELTEIYVCPHERADKCRCCKPSPWFLQRAAEKYDLDLGRSYMIGDHPHDVTTGQAAGATGIYVLSGHGLKHRAELGIGERIVAAGIGDAARMIVNEQFPSDDDSEVEEAARILRRGGLVALPTETVYGLGANVYDESAAARVFSVKKRPRFDPLIVHIPDISWMSLLVTEIPFLAKILAEAFWPGPLTLVLPRRPEIPDLAVAGLPTAAVRVPDHEMTRRVLRQAGVPAAAPSANRFGGVSPTTAAHVRQGLGAKVDMIVDGGPCQVGVESTIIGFQEGKPVLLRPGGIPVERIEKTTGVPVIRESSLDNVENNRVVSPGRLLRHYSPAKPMRLFAAADEVPVPPPGENWFLLLRQPREEGTEDYLHVEVLSATGDEQEIARRLFAALREAEQSSADLIMAEIGPDQGLGLAVNDRLRRAAAEAES